ncbi:MAG: type II toxin-antitoxin system RelE/ParE family toxin [Patescibacteria group bacterium]|jgi:phage-related protein
MIYNEEYKVKFYRDSRTGKSPVYKYIWSLDKKYRSKIYKYINYLRDNDGYLDEPYSRHIIDKIRELRVDFANNHYRIFYFIFVEKKIIFLHAYLKKTEKAPNKEIDTALRNYCDVINNPRLYEK